MKVICSWCGKTIGHKCRRCGRRADPLMVDDHEGGWKQVGYECPNCPIQWSSVAEPETHGICPECLKKAEGESTLPLDRERIP